jgi:phosphohistidine swiveling domain-containing protein
MPKKLEPKNYDFLWRIKNYTYFDNSLRMTRNFVTRDFLIVNKGDEYILYVSKPEKKRLSKLGLSFFKNRFATYAKEVERATRKKNIFKLPVKKLSTLTNNQLCIRFSKTLRSVFHVKSLYYYTEYFLFDDIEKKITNAPKQNQGLIKKVEKMRKLKFELRKLVNRATFKDKNYLFKEYLAEIKQRLGLKDIFMYSYKEIISMLKGGRVREKNRTNYVLGKFNNWKLITGKKAARIFDRFSEYESRNSEVRGQIANKGYYEGIVKIINFDHNSDIEKESLRFEEGAVLVTGSTIPQMMVAVMRAGAIVTEEGGIASHAALVSRELNKPCIIGTRIATKVLKNGDLVKVDANKGTVTKLI